MFQQIFKNIDDILRRGLSTELDYTEQTSWILFLKYLDELEKDRKDEAALRGTECTPILQAPYQWRTWAVPLLPNGAADEDNALTGDDLKDFVNIRLFPYLRSFKEHAPKADTIEYKVGEIFAELANKIPSGYDLREILNLVDTLRFRSQKEKFELSVLYEEKIKRMGNAGRNGGEYYTPRPLVRAIIHVVQPTIGQTIYDGAAGSAGFLCEAFSYLNRGGISTTERDILQKRTFFGKEKKPLAYVIAIMNMILHGIEAPNMLYTNTLGENLRHIQEKDRYDIILANPPFGGKERKEVQQNFTIKTGETAFLFLQHFIKVLRAGGKAGVVIKNTFLSNGDTAAVNLRRELLQSCNLHTILDLPSGVFQGAGVKTVVLFFTKGTPTRTIWYYKLDPGRSLGKTTALCDDDLMDFVTMQQNFTTSPQSWTVDIADIDAVTFDLSVKNPHTPEQAPARTVEEILDEIANLDAESTKLLKGIRMLLHHKEAV